MEAVGWVGAASGHGEGKGAGESEGLAPGCFVPRAPTRRGVRKGLKTI